MNAFYNYLRVCATDFPLYYYYYYYLWFWLPQLSHFVYLLSELDVRRSRHVRRKMEQSERKRVRVKAIRVCVCVCECDNSARDLIRNIYCTKLYSCLLGLFISSVILINFQKAKSILVGCVWARVCDVVFSLFFLLLFSHFSIRFVRGMASVRK